MVCNQNIFDFVGPWGYHANWNKSDREGQTWSQLYVESKKQKENRLEDTKNKLGVARGEELLLEIEENRSKDRRANLPVRT